MDIWSGGEAIRPINAALFITDEDELLAFTAPFLERRVGTLVPDCITRGLYTVAMSVLASNDAMDVGRKASATFFEVLVGHIVSIVDGIFGRGLYKGILVGVSETKLNEKAQRVTEICVPQQLQVYQRRIAHLERIYYLDPPDKYLALGSGAPRVQVMPLSAFFSEYESLLARS